MPIGIISSGGGASVTSGGRLWEDDGSVPVNLYVNNLLGDDDNLDGTSPTIGVGAVGPFATIARAIREVPVYAAISRTIHVAGTGVNYVLPPVLEDLNKVTISGSTSVASSHVISSINASSRANGLDLTIGSGMTVGAYRGKLIDFTSGPMGARYGWIYSNNATNIQVSQDTPGSQSYKLPAVSNTFDILDLDTTINLTEQTVITDCTQCTIENIHFTGTGFINTISTDQIVFRRCLLEYQRHQVGGFGRSLLLCCYVATTGDVQHGLLGVLNQAHIFINRGTVVDGMNAATHDHVRSVSQASWETDSEVVWKEVGEIQWRGTHVMARNQVAAGDHTWRFIDTVGIVGNDDNEAYWGAWDLPVCYGNVTSDYFLQGTRGCQGRIASGSGVATATTINAVSADDGATAVADAPDYTYFQGGDPAGIGNAQGPSSIEGVSNYGGNIDFVEADSIVITGNDATDEVVIGESHSSIIGNPHNTVVDKVSVSSNDSTPDYLENKLTSTTTGVSYNEVGDGGDEDLRLDIDSATEGGQGLIELATEAEVAARTDDTRAVTPLKHELADSLVHALAETSYMEVTRVTGQVKDVITYTDSGKGTKVRETNLTRTGGQVSVIVNKQYDSSGSLVQTLTGTVNRTGGRVSSIDWVES